MKPEAIKELRTALGISQAALASMIGYSQQSITKWESGYGVPPDDLAARLDRIFASFLADVAALRDGAGMDASHPWQAAASFWADRPELQA